MNIIICLDNNKGMLFNSRRQSRDKAVLADVIKNLKHSRLLISPFSEKLFSDYSDYVIVDDSFLEKANSGDYCFVEDKTLNSHESKIESIIVYNWCRDYPADFYCDIDFNFFKLFEETEFTGNSHEKITKQVFIKVGEGNEK